MPIFAIVLGLLALGATVIHLSQTWVSKIRRSYSSPSRLLRTSRFAYATITVLFALSAVGHATDTPYADSLALVAAVLFALVFGLESFTLAERRINEPAAPTPQNLLFVAAHPDDIEIAAGGTIAKLVDRGHHVHAVIMTDGAQGGDASVRPDEARGGAEFLGLESLSLRNFPDLHLEDHIQDMVASVEKAIAERDPDVIFTHSANDVHQDHCAVHTAVIRAARNHHSILCFESPSVTADFKPTVFFDTSDYREVKHAAIAAHANQLDKPYMTDETIDGITAFRGRQARVRRAEAFEVVRLQVSNVLPL